MIDKLADGRAGMDENARHMLPVNGIEHEQDGYDRQRPPDRAPCRFQQNQNEKTAEHNIRRRRIADAESQIIERYHRNMRDRNDSDNRQRPVDDGNAERPQQRRCCGLVVTLAGKRKDEKDQTQHEGKVNAAMHHFRQKAKARRIIVEDGKYDEQPADDTRRKRTERPKANLGVELFFQLARLGLIQFHG